MWRVEGKVEEEWFSLARFDEADRFVTENAGEVFADLLRFASVENIPDAVFILPRVEIAAAAKKSEERIEAAFQRMAAFHLAEMPFADDAGSVARRAQVIAKEPDAAGDAAPVEGGIFPTAKPVLVTTAQQPAARGSAFRCGHIAGSEAGAVLRDGINGRGRDVLAAVEPGSRLAIPPLAL